MLQQFQIIASVVNVTATGDIIKFRIPITGTLRQIDLWTDSANGNGDNIFNLNIASNDLYSGGARPKIAQSATHGQKTGLSDALTFGDECILQLETMATGGVAHDLVLQLTIEDGTGVATETQAATGKTTPVDADELAIVDSAASNVLKKLTWANLKATLKTYFDTLYLAVGGLINATQLQSRNIQQIAVVAGYSDNFPGSSLSGYTINAFSSSGTVTVASNKAHVNCTSSSGYYTVNYNTNYKFSEGAFLAGKLENISGDGAYFGLIASGGTDTTASDAFFIFTSSGNIAYWIRVGGGNDFGLVTYNSTTMKYWRFLRSGANILFQTSPDNSTWTTQGTKTFGYAETTTFHPFFAMGNGNTGSFDISEITSNLGLDPNYPDKSQLQWDRGSQQFSPVTNNTMLHAASEDGVVPTAAGSTGAGTGATFVLDGVDIAHSVTLTAGSSPATSAKIATITLHGAFGKKPRVVFSPGNGNAAAISGVWVDSTATNTYEIWAGGTALTASSIYKWNIEVLN